MALAFTRYHWRRWAAPLCALLLCAACARQPVPPRTLAIAAAADLKFAIEDIAPAFHRARPDLELRASFGSSGNFYAQLHNGAPFDAYLSADVQYPRMLLRDGIGKADSLFVYGVGRIVVWVPASSPMPAAGALLDPGVKHIAIANPQHAPYGRAAEAALRSMGLYDKLKPKLVLGEDISQTFEFVESGAADVGIVALSLALAPSAHGKYWEIPVDAYPRIEQAGLILKDSPDSQAFRAFLVSGEGRAILKRYGFYLGDSR